MKHYYSSGVRGQDTRSRDAGAGSRGVDGDKTGEGCGFGYNVGWVGGERKLDVLLVRNALNALVPD